MGVQVDVTSKTEGTAIGDKAGVPLLVKYDARLREKGKDNVAEITDTVQARPSPSMQSAIVDYLRFRSQLHIIEPAFTLSCCT